MARHAVYGDAGAAELGPADAAMLAAAAALVVMVHHALTDQRGIDAGADGSDDAAWFVTRDDGAAGAEPERGSGVARGAIGMQIAAAHTRRLHLQNDFAGSGCRIGELLDLELAIAEEHDAAHWPTSCGTWRLDLITLGLYAERMKPYLAIAAVVVMLAGCARATLPYKPEQQPAGAKISAGYQMLADRLRIEIDTDHRRLEDIWIVRSDGNAVRAQSIENAPVVTGPGPTIGVGVGGASIGRGVGIGTGVGVPVGEGPSRIEGSTFATFPLDQVGPPPWPGSAAPTARC